MTAVWPAARWDGGYTHLASLLAAGAVGEITAVLAFVSLCTG